MTDPTSDPRREAAADRRGQTAASGRGPAGGGTSGAGGAGGPGTGHGDDPAFPWRTEGIVVIAATNRSDVRDDALTRPGRFDRKITVSAPDAVGREQILKVHTRDKPLAADVDLQQIALTTPGMTGADLANLANEAALLAAKREQTAVTGKDFADALEKVQLGSERAVVMPDEEKERTAYHEAGHALAGMLRPGADPVRKISIIPRGRALGVTLSTPETDKYGYDYDYLRGRLVGALGGMAAEQEIYGVTTTGAESDLQTATNIARQMVGRWGMSEKVGPVQVYPQEGSPRDHHDKHVAIVRALMEKETLDEAEAYEVTGIERPWVQERHLLGATREEGAQG